MNEEGAMDKLDTEEGTPSDMEMPPEDNSGGMSPGAQDGGAPETDNPIHPALMETMVKGAEALFYTAVQVVNDKNARDLMRKQLGAGKVRQAAEFVVDQSLKIHKKQDMPLTGPMVIASIYWIVQYLCSLARAKGARINEASARMYVLNTIDWFVGRLRAQKYQMDADKEGMAQAQKMAAAGAGGAPPSGPQGEPQGAPTGAALPPDQSGMGAAGAVAQPQGGLM